MPTLFKYQKHVTDGPNGTTVHFKNSDAENEQATQLGDIDGWTYVSVPNNVEMPEQPTEINWQQVESTHALIEQLKRSRPVCMAKDVLRKKIEVEVGDLQDLVADSMRLNEFALALCLRVSHEVLTGEPMSTEHKQAYTARVEAALSAIDSGDVLLRGAVEDPTNMMVRLMSRYSKLNELVRDSYKPTIDALLPEVVDD